MLHLATSGPMALCTSRLSLRMRTSLTDLTIKRLSLSSSSASTPASDSQSNTKEPSASRATSAKPVSVTVTSASVPPLVRSLLVKAASVMSSSQPPASSSTDAPTASQVHDPVSSLFIRSGSAPSATASAQSNHGLEFLVNISKTSKATGDNCILEPIDPSIANVTPLSKLSLKQRLEIYLALGKARLSALVVLTSSFGYGLALSSSSVAAVSPFVHVGTLAAATIGTAFLAVGANTLNQFCEAPYDSQMPRTRNRPLAVRALSPEHALVVGVSSSLLGAATLALATNPLTTALGVANCLLYAGVYTPMKRSSSYNTWVGAIVGALPPLMGWSAATGGHLDAGAYVLACILFSWQFPHFMALSWNMRGEYARAGYQVLAVVDPAACRRAALRHSLLLTAFCSVATPIANLAPWSFALLSFPVNAYLLKLSYRFRYNPDAASARSLFRFSLIYLPSLLSLLALTNYLGR